MGELRVAGHVNGRELEFDARAPDAYEAETGRSPDGAYRTEIVAEDAYGNVSVAADTVYTEDAWIEPVWWRTRQDLERALNLSRRVAKGGLPSLTPSEQKEWLSGLLACLNAHDLNRIEIDTRWLENALYAYGYGLASSAEYKTDWTMTDMPLSGQLGRIRSNVDHLLEIYHEQETALPNSLEDPDWQTINALERVLYEMRDMLRRMEQGFRYSGTFYSGQEVVLP